MIRSLAFLCALFAVAAAQGPAQSSTTAARGARALPMQFELRTEGPQETCGTKCRRFVTGFGAITADTPRDFLAFAAGKELRGMTIAFDSDGGSTHGAMALGRELRRLDMITTVGRAVEVRGDPSRVTLETKVDCESMCAFVLFGGSRRHVPPQSRVMVHQIWLGDRRDDPTAANYSAEDLVLVQRDIGRLVQYAIEMGASAELIDVALRIPPWEPMRQLTRDELRRMNFITVDNPFDPATAISPVAVVTPTPAAPAVSAPAERSKLGRRAWNLLDGTDGTALTRRHPITVEGDEIGAFDLTFACGPSADSYLLSYSEQRRGAIAPRLDRVIVALGAQKVPLQLASLSVKGGEFRGESFASASVPADWIRAVAIVTNRSMTVSTSGGGETSIRLGNTGLAQNFPLLAASCEKALTAKNEPLQKAKPGTLAHADSEQMAR